MSSSRVMPGRMDSIFARVPLTHSSRFSEHESCGDDPIGLTRLEAQRVTDKNITGNRKTVERRGI